MATARGQPEPLIIRARNEARRIFKEITDQATRTDKAIAGLGRRSPKTLRESLRVIHGELRGMDVTTRQVATAFGNLEKVGKRLATVGLAGGVFSLASVKQAGDFSVKIAEIATLTDAGAESTKRLKSEVLGLSDAYGLGRDDVAGAYYQALSAGATEGAEAVGLLDTSARLAIGGVTSLTTAVDTITSVLNAYNRPVSDAEQISDQLFTTVKLGKTTVDQLGAAIANVTPIAAAAGFEFDEVAAAIAAITAGGTKTKIATTQLRSLFASITKGGDELDAVFRKFGGVSTVIAESGLTGALDILADATDRDIGKLTELLGSVESVQAVLSLTGENATRFAGALDGMANSAGASATAFGVVDETLGAALGRTVANLSNAFEAFGDSLAPIATRIADIAGAFARWAREFVENNPIASLVAVASVAASVLGGLLVTVGKFGVPALRLIGTLTGISGAVAFLSKAIGVLRVAALALIGTPIGPFLLALGAAAAIAANGIANVKRELREAREAAEFGRETLDDVKAIIAEAEKLNVSGVREEAVELARAATRSQFNKKQIEEGRAALRARLDQVRALTAERSKAEAEIASIQRRNTEARIEHEKALAIDTAKDRIEHENDLLRAIDKRIREAEQREAASIKRLKSLREQSADIGKELDRAIDGPQDETVDPVAALQAVVDLRSQVAQAATADEVAAVQAAIREQAAKAETIENDKERLLILRNLKAANEQLETQIGTIEAAEAVAAEQRKARDETEKAAAQTRLEDLKAKVDELSGKTHIVPVEVDTSAAEQRLFALEQRLNALKSGGGGGPFPTGGGRAPEPVPAFASGGPVPGYGGGDRIWALLEAGEFVVRKERARLFPAMLDYINGMGTNALAQLTPPRFALGGAVPASSAEPSASPRAPVQVYAGGQMFPTFATESVAEGLGKVLSREALKSGRRVARRGNET